MNVFKKIWNIVTTLIVIVVVLAAAALVGVRFFGLTPMSVLSGSMEPAYHVGALIYVKDIDPADITVGMPITFVVNEDLLVATHRVVKIDTFETTQKEVLDEDGNPLKDEDGETVYEEVPLEETSYYFTTKGDANDVEDGAPVYYKNVVGTPVFTIPYLGYVSNWLQTRKGMIVASCGAAMLLLLAFIPDIIRNMDDTPKKKRRKKPKRKKPAEEG